MAEEELGVAHLGPLSTRIISTYMTVQLGYTGVSEFLLVLFCILNN